MYMYLYCNMLVCSSCLVTVARKQLAHCVYMWGHRSVSIDIAIATWVHSNLIFFGSYGYPSVAIFRVHAAEWQAIMLTLWKNLCSVEKVVVLALWSCASLHPRALQWSCTQFLSWCLVCWVGSERFVSARFQLRSRRQRGLEVYLSIWENSAFLGKLGSLLVTWRTWEATPEATLFCDFGALYEFFLMTSFWDDF